MRAHIQASVVFFLVHDTEFRLPMTASLRFDADDPFIVRFRFSEDLTWEVGIELLVAAYQSEILWPPAGDIRFYLDKKASELFIYLHGPDGEASVVFHSETLHRFVARAAACATPPIQKAYLQKGFERLLTQ